jgi:ABC-type dipeptide/oligopeptide/nickel transport system permease subunit
MGISALLLVVTLLGLQPWAAGALGMPPAPQAGLSHAGGREIAVWWVLATRNVLGVVIGTTLVAAVVGTGLGAASVYGGAGFLFRLVEFAGAVPGLILVGILRFGDPSGGVLSLMATLALMRSLEVARLVRAQVLAILPNDYVEASRALGASRRWQLRVHVLPRLARPLAVNLIVGAAALVGLEAALSFTGLGLPGDVPSWGGGLAVLAGKGSPSALACVVASIGLTSALLYGIGSRLAVRRPGSADLPPPGGSSLARKGASVKGLS